MTAVLHISPLIQLGMFDSSKCYRQAKNLHTTTPVLKARL